jgi:glutamate-1-semialdehyde 2,1-aminomutase
MVLPEPGYHEALRALTRRAGSLLILDETHTISTGPGGYTRAFRLEPDMLTLGKPVGGGVPAAVYGFSAEAAEMVRKRTIRSRDIVAGIGGTLSGNWLATKAMRANLEHVMTDANYERMQSRAARLAEGIEGLIEEYDLPWHVTRLGARVEYRFQKTRPRNGSEASRGGDPLLDRFIHLYLLNRGILITPLHNMALVSPDTSDADVDRYCEVLGECVNEMRAAGAV